MQSDQAADNRAAENAETGQQQGSAARRLVRRQSHAALATSLDGQPYASLVAVAADLDASPLLLLSDLAQHTHNLQAEPRLSLLFEDTAGHADPLAGPRLTLLGQAERVDDPRLLARFTARHQSSRIYAGFADFHLYRVAIERGHLVAGFGRIVWLPADELRLAADAAALAGAESDILEHMNCDHGEAIALYAERLLGRPGGDWQIIGIDPEGCDLRRDQPQAETARLNFAQPVLTPAAARQRLVALAEEARLRPLPL
ncbi:MAG: HugZ family protein [Thiohalocapsa sp.]